MQRTLITLACALAAACTSATTPQPMPGDPDAGDVAGDPDAAAELALPFAVDNWFAPAGYMGDGEVANAITDEVCEERGGEGRGVCHRFTWTPADRGWAGVYWQHPDGNWGTQSGLAVPAGATQVSFHAWSPTGGETVRFMVGMADVDGFVVESDDLALTTTPTAYTLPLANTGYGEVVGGFGWVSEGATSAVVFFVDDIVWE